MSEPRLTPEEMQRLLMSLLTQRPDEKAPETSPLEAGRGHDVTSEMQTPWIYGGGPAYRVPTNDDGVGTQEQAAVYQEKLKEAKEGQRREQTAAERAYERLNRRGRAPR